jgi:hypothetical protein
LDSYDALTLRLPKNERQSIIIGVQVGVPVPIKGFPANRKMLLNAKALIDTGATGSCVSKDFAEGSRLVFVSMATVFTAQGRGFVPVYNIDIALPNSVMFSNIEATEFSGGQGFDVIIGMDILCKGDMAITNANEETVFSFRIPPDEVHIVLSPHSPASKSSNRP